MRLRPRNAALAALGRHDPRLRVLGVVLGVLDVLGMPRLLPGPSHLQEVGSRLLHGAWQPDVPDG